MENYLKIQLGPLYNATEISIENLEFVIKKSEDFLDNTHVLKVEKIPDFFDVLLVKAKK